MEQTKTIKTENGELYVIGDIIVGRMEIDGNITRWYKGDKLHRDGDLPAVIKQNTNGVVTYEVYWRDDKRHRDGDLPAIIMRNNAGAVTCEEYYHNDKKISKEDIAAAKKEKEAAELTEKFTRDLAEANARADAANTRADAAVAELAALKAKIKAMME